MVQLSFLNLGDHDMKACGTQMRSTGPASRHTDYAGLVGMMVTWDHAWLPDLLMAFEKPTT